MVYLVCEEQNNKVKMNPSSEWTVSFSTQAMKMVKKFQKEKPKVYTAIFALARDLEIHGPILKNWPNFGLLHKMKGIPQKAYHCHLQRGKPTYVACWKINDTKKVEVYYVGTHENAPY